MNNYTPNVNNTTETQAYSQPVYEQPVTAQPVTSAAVYAPSSAQVQQAEKKVWRVFAKISYIFGFLGIGCAFIPFIPLNTIFFPLYGIVFAILGKKAPSMASKAKTALVCNIIGTVLWSIMICVYLVLICVFSLIPLLIEMA